ncbi:MAG: DUF3137 domain-containing protein [Myxococcota bacterium]
MARAPDRLSTGDEDFDRQFDVVSQKEQLVQDMLDEPMRERIRSFHATMGMVLVRRLGIETEHRGYGVEGALLERTFREQVALSEALERAMQRAVSKGAPDRAFR